MTMANRSRPFTAPGRFTSLRASQHAAKRTTIDGFAFDSAAEARHYGTLSLLVKAGKITGLRVHPRYTLKVNGRKLTTYVADFEYLDAARRTVVEDVKPKDAPIDRLSKLKMDLFNILNDPFDVQVNIVRIE